MDKAVQKVPEKFRALVAASAGNSFSDVATVIEIETPELREDEALIRVAYAGVNGGCETFRARGEHSFQGNKDVKNFRLGAEGVGHVVAVGSEVNNVAVGDAVCFVGSAFSEYTTSKASMLWVVPEATPEYVGLRISALTSCAMLEQTGNIQQGEKILITAAAGGAGHFAVQFAKLAGCEVIGTCGSDEKAQLLKELGCDHVINYKNQDVKVELNRIAPDGLDVVLEGVGGIMLKTALECLGPEGRLLQIGYISEYPHNEGEIEDSNPDINVAELFWKSQTIHRLRSCVPLPTVSWKVSPARTSSRPFSSSTICRPRMPTLPLPSFVATTCCSRTFRVKPFSKRCAVSISPKTCSTVVSLPSLVVGR